jgi:hypothetical protein
MNRGVPLGGLQWQKVGRLQLDLMVQLAAFPSRALLENEPDRITMLLTSHGYTQSLSKQQIKIICARASCAQIRADFKLCNDEAVSRRLTRSVLGVNQG